MAHLLAVRGSSPAEKCGIDEFETLEEPCRKLAVVAECYDMVKTT
jgi:hypothetical protein